MMAVMKSGESLLEGQQKIHKCLLVAARNVKLEVGYTAMLPFDYPCLWVSPSIYSLEGYSNLQWCIFVLLGSSLSHLANVQK